MFVLWKVLKKTKFVAPEEADLVSGKAECDEECRIWEEGGLEENVRKRLEGMGYLRRKWETIW